MPGVIQQEFIVLVMVLLRFGRSLATKCIPIINQPFIVGSTLINLNPDELHYYHFIISLNRCDDSCDTVKDPFV